MLLLCVSICQKQRFENKDTRFCGISQKHAKAHMKKAIDSSCEFNKPSHGLRLWVTPYSWRSHSACNLETGRSPTDLVVPPRNKLWHGSYFKAPQTKTYRNMTLEPDLENKNSFLDIYFFLCPTSIPPLIWMAAIWIKMREETNCKKSYY